MKSLLVLLYYYHSYQVFSIIIIIKNHIYNLKKESIKLEVIKTSKEN